LIGASTRNRQQLLLQIAATVKEIMKAEDWISLKESPAKTASNELLNFVKPILNIAADGDLICRDAKVVLEDAIEMSTKMYSKPYDWMFEFPKFGELFASKNMINRDGYIKGNKPRVKLGITPVIVFRNATGPAIVAIMVQRSSVLLTI